jgi:hypothetical protein
VKTLTVTLMIIAMSLPAFAQNEVEYPIVKIKGEYILIGQKVYKKISGCEEFEEGDTVTFSEDPITCETVTALDVTELKECKLECLENMELPPDPE